MKRSEKQAQLELHPTCYVCDAMGLPNADFSAYEMTDLNFDHWKPKGLVGSDQADLVRNQVPIHAHKDGASYLDPNYETAVVRNCHKGKGNKFKSGEDWVAAVKIWRKALKTDYSDDLLPGRDSGAPTYRVSIKWDEASGHAEFRKDKYPMMVQNDNAGQWRSFSTVTPAKLLWTDTEVQSRPADPKRVAELAIHLRDNPLLSPILCRLSNGRLNVFDGNHRLCAFLLARPNEAVPVTIFEGPDPKRFLEVVGKAHDELTQQKYQYTAKALKYSALNADELETCQDEYGDQASERLAWEGKTSKDVKLRIVGRISEQLDNEGGWREKWKIAGLTDKSWNDFLSLYAKLTPEIAPFASERYNRENELQNLKFLCQAFDEELFDMFGNVPKAKASLKTKWWKAAHRRFHTRTAQVVRDALHLPETPRDPAYTPKKWNNHIKKQIRGAVKKWRESPAWRHPTTANNEPDVAKHLNDYEFTENYLM